MGSSAARDPRRPSVWEYLALLLVLVLLLVWGFTSCSPRIIERVTIQRDTTYITRTDSVRFYDRDSIFIREKGDTIYQYVERWRWRDRVRVDTILRTKVDSFAVERVKEVQVEKPLSAWKTAKIGAFWWLVAAVLLLLVWTFRKSLLKLIGK